MGQVGVPHPFTLAELEGLGLPRGQDLEQLRVGQGELRPDLTFFLDVPVQTGLQRAGRCGPPDRFESEQAEFFERVRGAYLERAFSEPRRFRVVVVLPGCDLPFYFDDWLKSASA